MTLVELCVKEFESEYGALITKYVAFMDKIEESLCNINRLAYAAWGIEPRYQPPYTLGDGGAGLVPLCTVQSAITLILLGRRSALSKSNFQDCVLYHVSAPVVGSLSPTSIHLHAQYFVQVKPNPSAKSHHMLALYPTTPAPPRLCAIGQKDMINGQRLHTILLAS